MVMTESSTCSLCGELFIGTNWRVHFKEECTGRDRILDNLNDYRSRRGSYRGEQSE